jgi:hypothetical protein
MVLQTNSLKIGHVEGERKSWAAPLRVEVWNVMWVRAPRVGPESEAFE